MTIRVSESKIIEACKSSDTMIEAAAKCGIRFSTFARHAKRLGVYKPNPNQKGVAKGGVEGYDVYDILAGKYPHFSAHKLKLKLYHAGLKTAQCEECGITEWNGKELSFHLDHINGNRCDNRLDNLRILCPNCHSQTDTYSGKTRGKTKIHADVS